MKYKKLVFIALGVLIISITLLVLTTDNSQTIVFAYYDGGANAFTIDLRDNGKYRIQNSSWLTSNDFNGHYTLVNNIITLDKKNIDNVILTDKLKICNCPGLPSWSCLLQVDEHGNGIDAKFRFTVRIDNRPQ